MNIPFEKAKAPDKKKEGFTLIEIMVASSIFIIVMFIAVGAILSLVDGNRRAQALSSVVSNLNISLESMVRDIRTGTNYQIPGSNDSISFNNSDGDPTTYSLSSNSIVKYVTHNGSTLESGPITAPEVNVSSLTFLSKGIGADQIQPLVLLQIVGSVGTGKYTSPFTIQTLISQRVLEN